MQFRRETLTRRRDASNIYLGFSCGKRAALSAIYETRTCVIISCKILLFSLLVTVIVKISIQYTIPITRVY